VVDHENNFEKLSEEQELQCFHHKTNDTYNIRPNPINFLKEGNNLTVYEAKNKKTGENVIIKKFLKEGIDLKHLKSEFEEQKKKHHGKRYSLIDRSDFQNIYKIIETVSTGVKPRGERDLELQYFYQETNYKYRIEPTPIISGKSWVYYKAENTETHEYVAIKIVLKSDKNLKNIESEVKTMNKQTHPSIISIQEVIGMNLQNLHYVYIVTDLGTDGDLYDKCYGKQRSFIPEKTAKIYLKKIIEGLKYLHSRNIVHGDLKPENIILGKDGSLKIIDFEVAHE
jgi:serine/threonine protein kinase